MVGLGNPGENYAGNRHNAGFLLAERLAERAGSAWERHSRFRSRLARCVLAGRPVLVAQPLTYMNASGEAVGPLVRYHRIPLDRLLVLVDDADLQLGQLRLRPSGSPGGHHGLESIEQQLGSRGFARLRLGIGRQPGPRRGITSHVLGDFAPPERRLFNKVLDRAADQVDCWVAEGVAAAMNQFNGTVQDPETEEN